MSQTIDFDQKTAIQILEKYPELNQNSALKNWKRRGIPVRYLNKGYKVEPFLNTKENEALIKLLDKDFWILAEFTRILNANSHKIYDCMTQKYRFKKSDKKIISDRLLEIKKIIIKFMDNKDIDFFIKNIWILSEINNKNLYPEHVRNTLFRVAKGAKASEDILKEIELALNKVLSCL